MAAYCTKLFICPIQNAPLVGSDMPSGVIRFSMTACGDQPAFLYIGVLKANSASAAMRAPWLWHTYRTGRSVCACRSGGRDVRRYRVGREDVESASGPASPILTEYGRRVGGLGPGLTCESADALSGCPANDSSGRRGTTSRG
jgi:hypothetical protein